MVRIVHIVSTGEPLILMPRVPNRKTQRYLDSNPGNSQRPTGKARVVSEVHSKPNVRKTEGRKRTHAGGTHGVPEVPVGVGVGQIRLSNKAVGLSLVLPVNPESIKWQGQLVTQTNDTKAGYHYQFIKYRRTSGSISFNTGSGRNRSFGPGIDKQFGGPTEDAYDYLMRLGWIFETWMKSTVVQNSGPLRLTDHTIPTHPIDLDIIVQTFPSFGPEAAKTSYDVQISFDIINDYQDKYDMSSVKRDIMPPLGRAADTAYTTKRVIL